MKKRQDIADLPNCTYWWIIHLAPGNKVPQLTGYSKFQGQAESNDKVRCLMAKIYMLYKNGYLEKATRIEIYKRLGALPNKQFDRHILTLTSNDWTVGYAELLPRMPHELKTFLTNFYLCIRDGKEVKHLLPLPDKEFKKDDQYQLHKHFFRSMDQLSAWCLKQLESGEPREQVLQFYTNYSTKHFGQ